jgi:structural maintenance of chromosome 2
MHIEEIIVDGFKSYAVRTVIAGFDRKFNAITGLNGSGKSNILDAICFVLGISNLSQVRAGNLNELVYKQGQAGVTKASVTIVFNNAERENSPVGYEEYAQITVTRQVVIGGRNKYLINGHTAQLSRVQNLFHSVQLNVNNPHFLIMQGRITKVINMKPPEVLAMIEEAAGTRMFEMKREAAVKTIEKKDGKVEEMKKVLAEEITPTLDKLRTERGAYMQFTASSAECERLERFVTAHEYHAAQLEAERGARALDELTEEHGAHVAAAEELRAEQAAKEAAAAAAAASGESAGSKEARRAETDAEALSRDVVKATAACGHKREAAARERAAAEAHRTAAVELERVADSATAGAQASAARLAELRASHDAAAAELRQRESTYEGQLGVGTDATANTLAAQEQQAVADATNAASEAKQAATRAKHLAKELLDASHKLAAAKSDGDRLGAELDALAKAEGAARRRLEALGHDEGAAATLAVELRAAEARAADARGRADALGARLSGCTFQYTKPSASFDARAVRGTVAELVTVREARMALALEVLAGGKLQHVVVDTETTAKALLERGKLQRRTTFAPLSKIQARTVPAAKLAAARALVGAESVWSALELLDYAADVAPAVAYAFGGSLVCVDAPTAKRLAFDKSVGVACVTLDGDNFNPAGTLTGGSRPPAGEGLLARMAKLAAARADADGADGAARELGGRAERAAAASDEAARLSGELQLIQHNQALARERIGASAYGQLLATRDALAADADACEAARDKATAAERAAKARAAELKASAAEFATDTGAQLAKLKKAIGDGKKALAAKAKELDAARQLVERGELALGATADERGALLALADGCERDAAALDAEAAQMAAALAGEEGRLRALEETLKAHRAQCKAHAERAAAARADASRAGKQLAELTLNVKRADQKLARARKDGEGAHAAMAALCAKHAWIADEARHFGAAGTDYDFAAREPARAAERLRALIKERENLSKRVNKKALAMFERAEAEHDELQRKKAIIEGDKGKIEAVINELDKKKKARERERERASAHARARACASQRTRMRARGRCAEPPVACLAGPSAPVSRLTAPCPAIWSCALSLARPCPLSLRRRRSRRPGQRSTATSARSSRRCCRTRTPSCSRPRGRRSTTASSSTSRSATSGSRRCSSSRAGSARSSRSRSCSRSCSSSRRRSTSSTRSTPRST